MYEGLYDLVLMQTNSSVSVEKPDTDANTESTNDEVVPIHIQPRESSQNIPNLLDEALLCLKKASDDLNDATNIDDKNLLLGITKFSKRVGKMSQGQLATALHTFGCSTFKRRQGITSTTMRRIQKGKISVQPESVKRRKSKLKGKKALPKGGHSEMLPAKETTKKRVHCFAKNVEMNEPVAKKHAKTMMSCSRTFLAKKKRNKKGNLIYIH